MLEEKNTYVEKVIRIMHPDGWGYEILNNGKESFTVKNFDYSIKQTEEIEISSLLIRTVAEELLKLVNEVGGPA